MVKHIIRADILLIARNSQNIRAYYNYMLNHRIRCMYYIKCTLLQKQIQF